VSALSQPLAELLAYLGEIGYGDLYLRPPVPGGVPEKRSELAVPSPTPPAAFRATPSQDSGPAGPVKTLDVAERAAQLAALAAAAAGCTRCRLCEGRTRVVFGSGHPDAELMLIGEGPGSEEDRQGLPFVGPAGELLTKIIQAMEMKREDLYIANIVKCRPPGNRDPQPDEVAACRGYLEQQIAFVQPRVIVALGKVAAQTLLGNESPIGQMRGRWYRVQGVPAMVTYHPAALLRNQGLKRPTWEDMQQVRDHLRGLRGLRGG
jgi:uracil-DNA glycosylase family 4